MTTDTPDAGLSDDLDALVAELRSERRQYGSLVMVDGGLLRSAADAIEALRRPASADTTDWRGICQNWAIAFRTGRNEPLAIMADVTRNALQDAALAPVGHSGGEG